MTAAIVTDGDHTHVYSVFGRWCYLCGLRKHWWAFWQKWTDEEHYEPF